MEDIRRLVWIDGEGYCEEITVNRYDNNGINTPFVIYEPIENNSK
tara:strand:- start:1049 stop:1183 length:135 start_codon:yes stop_codon:yes gene_type:complete